jgi:hypothetical protein
MGKNELGQTKIYKTLHRKLMIEQHEYCNLNLLENVIFIKLKCASLKHNKPYPILATLFRPLAFFLIKFNFYLEPTCLRLFLKRLARTRLEIYDLLEIAMINIFYRACQRRNTNYWADLKEYSDEHKILAS